jgi:hypothetical protein
MLDVVVCLATFHKCISNCQVILDGLERDHQAIRLNLVLTLIKFNDTKSLYSGAIDWRKILTNDGCRKIFNDAALEAMAVDMDYKEFNKAIRQSGTKLCSSSKKDVKDGTCLPKMTSPRS